MFTTIFSFALVVLWLGALFTSHSFGGYIHMLPIIAIVAFLEAVASASRRNDVGA